MKTFAFSLMTISLIIFGIASLFILELSYAREIELVAAWLFDEGSGSTVRDASGNGNDGILKNDPKWTDGKFSKALKFSGGSYVEVEDSDILDLEDEVTVALWFFPTFSGNQAGQTLITKGDDAHENYEILIWVSGQHVHTGWVFKSVGRVTRNSQGNCVVKDKWQHVAVTYKPGDWLVYMNGELVHEMHERKEKLLVNDRPLKIGADPACAPEAFDGVIDEVVVFLSHVDK